MQPLRNSPTSLILITLVILFWSLDFVITKHVALQYHVYLIVLIRLSVLSLLTLPIIIFSQPAKPPLLNLLVVSFLFTAMHLCLWITALSCGLNACTLAFIELLGVPMTLLLGTVFLKERLSFFQILGTIVAFSGAALILLAKQEKATSAPGYATMIACVSVLAWSGYQIYLKKLLMHYRGASYQLFPYVMLLGTVQIGIAILCFAPEVLPNLRQITRLDLITIFATCVMVLAFHMALYSLLKKHHIQQISPFFLLSPFLVTVLSHLLFDERITEVHLAGGLVICCGLLVMQLKKCHSVELEISRIRNNY